MRRALDYVRRAHSSRHVSSRPGRTIGLSSRATKSSNAGWRLFVDLGEYRIEAANTAEAGTHRDRRHGELRLVEKAFCTLNPGGLGYLDRARTELSLKEAAQMPRANAEPRRKRINAVVIESAAVDQSERAFNRGPRSFPRRREWSRLGSASEAGAEASCLCRSCGWIEGDVLGLRRAYRAHRPAIDTRCADA